MTDGIQRATNFGDTVHRAPNYPSYSYFPNADAQAQTLDNGALANYGAYPFLYANREQGPPPTMKCPVGLRYSDANRMWFCPTAPCMGPKPHDRAYCDSMSGKWYVPTIGGQQYPLYGSLVQMSKCEQDPAFPPAIGTRGTVECDMASGRNYYDLDNGAYYWEDYSGMPDQSEVYNIKRIGRAGLTITSTRPSFNQSVSLDRAYSGFQSQGVPFADDQGRLHPAQTAVGKAHHRTRGYFEKNANVRPVASRQAVAEPKHLRAGYMTTAMSDDEARAAQMMSSFNPDDLEAVRQMYLRPGAGVLLERDATIHRFNNQ